jgi:hypothetical protein
MGKVTGLTITLDGFEGKTKLRTSIRDNFDAGTDRWCLRSQKKQHTKKSRRILDAGAFIMVVICLTAKPRDKPEWKGGGVTTPYRTCFLHKDRESIAGRRNNLTYVMALNLREKQRLRGIEM